MHSKKQAGLHEHLKNLLLRILDRLSAFCTGTRHFEPVPVRIRSWPHHIILCGLTLICLLAAAENLDEKDHFPPLRSSDLPVLAQGIPDENIVLDQSLCNLSKEKSRTFNPGLNRVQRSCRETSAMGRWI